MNDFEKMAEGGSSECIIDRMRGRPPVALDHFLKGQLFKREETFILII